MAQIETFGLVRDNNLADIADATSSLSYMLTQLVGKSYTSFDLDFLRDISTYSQLSIQLPKIRNIILTDILSPTLSKPIRPLVTFKNRLDRYKIVTGEPNFHGGSGLTCNYYSWSQIYPSLVNLPTTFNKGVFDGKQSAFTEIFWERGVIDYGDTVTSAVTTAEGIVKYTGFFKPVATGRHSFGINSDTTGSVIIELTDLNGNNVLITNNKYTPGSGGVTIITKALEKFKFYNISIYYFKSPNQVITTPRNILSIYLQTPILRTGLLYNYLYDENYINKSTGTFGNYYNNKLPLGGTNFFDKTTAGAEYYSLGGNLSADYKALLTRGKIIINYKPPKLYTDVVKEKPGIALNAGEILITDIPDTSDLRVGNLVLNSSKTLNPFTYIKEIVDSTTVLLNLSAPTSHSSNTIYFIEQKGLKGYTLGYTPDVSLSAFKNLSSFNGDPLVYREGDVVISKNNSATGYTRISGTPTSSLVKLDNYIVNTGHTDFLLFYYKSGLQNITLNGYCSGSSVLPILNTTNSVSVSTGSSTIYINDLYDYDGKQVNIQDLVTTDVNISAYRIDYALNEAAISYNTYITNVDSVSKAITLSKPTVGVIKAGNSILISLSTPSNPASNNPKYVCFAPGDTSAPFIATLNGIETPSLSSINLNRLAIEFKALKIQDTDSSSIIDIADVTPSYSKTLRVTDSKGTPLLLFLK